MDDTLKLKRAVPLADGPLCADCGMTGAASRA
jgi:hypothetical protein